MTGAVGGIGTGVRVAVTAVRLVVDTFATDAVLTAVVVATRVVVTAGEVTFGAATRVTLVAPKASGAVTHITLAAASAHKTLLILGSPVPCSRRKPVRRARS